MADYPLILQQTGGDLVQVLFTAPVYKDAASNVLGVLATARGATHSRHQLREFSDTRAFLDNILQSSTKYSIVGMDLDRLILSWNEGAHRNYGYTADEAIGADSSMLFAPEDVESGAIDRLRATAYEDGLAEGEFERVRKDGSRFTASVVVTRRDDALGHPIGLLLMSTDISKEKLAEKQLHSTAQYARSLIEASQDPLVTISPGRQHHRRERGDDPGDGGGTGAAGRHRLRGLLHRAGPGPRELPPGFRAGLRDRLPADHPAHRRRPDRRALQRLAVQAPTAPRSAWSPPPRTYPPGSGPSVK